MLENGYHLKTHESEQNLNDRQKRKSKQTGAIDIQNFPYAVEFASKEYHIVKNRYNSTGEDSMMVVKNRRTLDGFKNVRSTTNLHKQSDRKQQFSNAHEMRFESIDKDTTALSNNKRCFSFVSFDKARDRDFPHILNRNTVLTDYVISEKLVKRNYDGCVSLDKQSRRWEEDPYGSVKIKTQFQTRSSPGLQTFDQLKASEQKIKMRVRPNVAGLVSLDKQSGRNIFLGARTNTSVTN